MQQPTKMLSLRKRWCDGFVSKNFIFHCCMINIWATRSGSKTCNATFMPAKWFEIQTLFLWCTEDAIPKQGKGIVFFLWLFLFWHYIDGSIPRQLTVPWFQLDCPTLSTSTLDHGTSTCVLASPQPHCCTMQGGHILVSLENFVLQPLARIFWNCAKTTATNSTSNMIAGNWCNTSGEMVYQ